MIPSVGLTTCPSLSYVTLYDDAANLTLLALAAETFFVIFWFLSNTDDVNLWPGPNEYGCAKIL